MTLSARRLEREQGERDFEIAIFRTVREAAASAVKAGLATLEERLDEGGRHLSLEPVNPRASGLFVYPDYPTLAMEEGTTEMFGSKEKCLRELALLVRAVIAGRYEWEFGEAKAFGFIPMKRFKGTFHTDEGPWSFTRWGALEDPGTSRGAYEPY